MHYKEFRGNPAYICIRIREVLLHSGLFFRMSALSQEGIRCISVPFYSKIDMIV